MTGERVTDADWLEAKLRDGRWWTTNDLLRASFAERGCGLTVHSRAADVRRRVAGTARLDCERLTTTPVTGRAQYAYRLVAVGTATVATPHVEAAPLSLFGGAS